MNDSALLDLAESARRARPLRSWQGSQKEALRLRLAALHRAWSDEWLPARQDLPAEPEIHVEEPGRTTGLAASEDMACWAFAAAERRVPASLPSFEAAAVAAPDASAAALRAIAGRMFASDAGAAAGSAQGTARIATVVARAAWADWLRRIEGLLAGFGLEPQQTEGSREGNTLSNPWSGALSVHWPWCGGVWRLGLPHGAVAALLASESAAARPTLRSGEHLLPKEPLDQALADRRVALRVMLKGAELNLGQLQELRVDDVVPLEHLLDAPAQVVGADGGRVCDGWLGQSDGRIAIELAVSAPSAAGSGLRMNTQQSKETKQ
ncbi:FliM/FliN family flagellar motor C-terminal domain-containing protein [Variovorax paradoxus]|uniref:FliM/FliN family flagellar motor C-terminal domain-containing protein n=1 Tax=Variovorax paradoxus TaxID=34073 RepID=UPI0029C92DBF|nr:FliM/FliN family flagellar motor C-terminal domain-containing protein [Variovorax paradoxus]